MLGPFDQAEMVSTGTVLFTKRNNLKDEICQNLGCLKFWFILDNESQSLDEIQWSKSQPNKTKTRQNFRRLYYVTKVLKNPLTSAAFHQNGLG